MKKTNDPGPEYKRLYESAVKGRQDFRGALRNERQKVERLKAVLETVKAALGDRLLADGPLSDSYAHSVMKDIDTALRE